ncbi:MAG: hypothetical protein JNM66_28315 [Bryobacterales bacterium]|nr:hypothetical protein [Bryobacterales bacterium]
MSDTQLGAAVLPCPVAPKPVHWLELELIGEDGKPIPFAQYRVRLPDGALVEGYLNSNGFSRLDGLTIPGSCAVCFPEFDLDAWSYLDSTPIPAGAP